MKIRTLLTTLLLLLCFGAAAQQGGVKGRIVSRLDRQPISDAKLVINTPAEQTVISGPDGSFVFENVPDGTWRITVTALEYMPAEVNVRVQGMMNDINFITLSTEYAPSLDDATFAEFDSENLADDAQSMPVQLSAGKDIFSNVAAYQFGAMRFRDRGYDTSTEDVFFNGVYLNDAQTGYTPWSLWSGMNDATRNQEVSKGMAMAEYGIGGFNGTTVINATASSIRKGFRFSLANGNNAYRWRALATYGSGKSDNGWSYALSFSTRQGGNDWVKGVYTNAFGYYGSVEKEFCAGGTLALTVIGAPSERGAQNASTQEVYDLVGSNFYNSNWGYQNGKMRNARVRRSHEPVIVLNYNYDISSRTKLYAMASYRFGFNGYSALDWYNNADPRPDYYRYLPSYYLQPGSNYNIDQANNAIEGWRTSNDYRHINWDGLYNDNYNSLYSVNPHNINYAPLAERRSIYVIEERHVDQRDANIKLQLVHLTRGDFKIAGGLQYRWNRAEYYKTIKDLLGGDSWLNVDQFAERDNYNFDPNIAQNDMDHPNRKVTVGDKYGYDYYGYVQDARAWASMSFSKGNWEGYAGLEGGYNTFWRDGIYRKGLFPDNSKGKSAQQEFWTYTGKAGATYKISGAHTVSGAVAYVVSAPYFSEAFISPRTRNSVIDYLTTDKSLSGELSYSLRLPGFKAKVTGFYGQIKDQTKLITFYDDVEGTFVNFAMSGIDQQNMGIEFGAEVALPANLYLTGVLNYGRYLYTSNPLVTETEDSSDDILLHDEPVYWKNYRVPGTPQVAANLGLEYRAPSYLFIGVDCNYYDKNYIDMNPVRRIDAAYLGLDDAGRAAMSGQEKFKSAFVLNANIGKSWYIKRVYNLGVNLSVNNILNNKDVRTGGYEQLRLQRNRDDGGTVTSYTPFPSRYFYLMGTNYYLNIFLRF